MVNILDVSGPLRWKRLGDYNAELGRGIVHTREWDAFMACEQADFDKEACGHCGSINHVTLWHEAHYSWS